MTMLAVEELTFGYGRDEPILDRVSFQVRRGAIVAITGESGRGKSTLLYLTGLLLTPWAGEIWVGDQPASGLSDRERSRLRARHIGFVFQDAALDMSRSVLDNVIEQSLYSGLPRADAIDRAHRLLEEMGVELRADHRPGQVSGGQAQRVALCRALLVGPSIVLADEPTGNLDSRSAEGVIRALEAAAAGGSCVLIATHDPQVMSRATATLAV